MPSDILYLYKVINSALLQWGSFTFFGFPLTFFFFLVCYVLSVSCVHDSILSSLFLYRGVSLACLPIQLIPD